MRHFENKNRYIESISRAVEKPALSRSLDAVSKEEGELVESKSMENGVLKLVIVSGLPGAGKSALAEGIAQKIGSPVFSVDPIESSMIKAGLPRNFETGLAAYLVAETLASEQLKLGISAIIDAVSPVEEAREMWRALSKRFDARLRIIECVLSPEVHKERINSRVRNMHGIPEVTWADVEDRRRQFVPWNEERLVIDSAEKIEDNVEKAMEYINH